MKIMLFSQLFLWNRINTLRFHFCLILNLIFAFILLFGLQACTQSVEPTEVIRSVKVMKVGSTTSENAVEYPAEIRARIESRLGFRVAGKLAKRMIEVGQSVKAGQILAELDAKDYQLATDAAKAQVNAAQTQFDLAQANLRRFQSLKSQNFISSAEIERHESTQKAAQANLEQARAQLNMQKNQADYAVLRSDVSGVVTEIAAEVGQVVAAGSPVFRVARDGARDVVFAVPEDRVQMLKIGSPIQVRSWANNQQFDANVREIAASADSATRTYTIKAALNWADNEKSALNLGSTMTVLINESVFSQNNLKNKNNEINNQNQTMIKLPTSALKQSGEKGQGSAVWVLDEKNMQVHLRSVQISAVKGNDVLISSGLKNGEQVVSAGVHVLTQGQKVIIYQDKYAKLNESANEENNASK